MNKIKRDYIFEIGAVIFGADETLLQVAPKDGFEFDTRSLIPAVDHLGELFNKTDMDLRISFEEARISEDTLDVIYVFKRVQLSEKFFPEVIESVSESSERELNKLDDYIRAIRLLKEGPVRAKLVHFSVYDKTRGPDKEDFSTLYSSILPIGESYNAQTFTKCRIFPQDLNQFNEQLLNLSFGNYSRDLTAVHRFYDMSYFQENYLALILLIISLETLYLGPYDLNSGGKKNKASKRSAVHLLEREDLYDQHYQKLKKLFDKRNKIMHEGVFTGVKNEEILFLRKCVRYGWLKRQSDFRSKEDFIEDLKAIVDQFDANFTE